MLIFFINALHNSGLIDLTTIKGSLYIKTIIHLLERINEMLKNVLEFENGLRLYESVNDITNSANCIKLRTFDASIFDAIVRQYCLLKN